MQRFKTILKVVISLGLLSYLVYISNPEKIIKVLGNIYKENGLIYLSLSMFFGLISVLLMSLRWKIILNSYGIRLHVKRLAGFYFIGLFFNNFLPTSIGGDIIRIYKVIGDSQDRTAAFASVILERILGIAATLFLAITSLYYVSQIFNDSRILYSSLILFVVIVLFFIIILREKPVELLIKVFDKITLLHLGEKIVKLLEAIYTLREKKSVFIWVFMLSLLSQVAIVFMNYTLAQSLDIKIELGYLFLVVPFTIILTMLPSINGVGVRDGGYIFLLSKIGIPAAAAISLSFMNVIIPLLLSLYGGVLFLIQKKHSKISEVKVLEQNL